MRPPEPRSSVIIVGAGGVQHALLVDALGGRQEIVVKPLSRLLKDSHGFSGATILGDGRVMLILDPRTMFATEESR
jgi:two-component system chemotaxis sensor kinase CheA